jgi:hypothetical protein
MKQYDSYEDMQARIAQEKADAAAEQHLLETTDDAAVADAIFRQAPTRPLTVQARPHPGRRRMAQGQGARRAEEESLGRQPAVTVLSRVPPPLGIARRDPPTRLPAAAFITHVGTYDSKRPTAA